MLRTLAVANYRSLRDLVVPLDRLTVVTGPNGSGKSSLYRALTLLADAAQGGLVASLAREGGLPSTLWAGPEQISRGVRSGRLKLEGLVRTDAVHLRLGFSADDFGYAVDLGLPQHPSSSAFRLDPEIKRECIWSGPVFRRGSLLTDRRGPSLRTVEGSGHWTVVAQHIPTFASMLTEFADPRDAADMITVRDRVRSWRFYDHVRSDRDAPARYPQVGTHTPVLGPDGADLAAALQTIREIGDTAALAAAVEDAFPGSTLLVSAADGWFEVTMQQRGLLRPLRAAELSEGTIRYLLLVAALLTPRPPTLLVLNEPETSLHPDLLPALARMIVGAAARTQVIVVTHSAPLADALSRAPYHGALALEKDTGETTVVGLRSLDRPHWVWPGR